ncbi:MAG TPA: hypothetical protein VJS12_17655 [Steroidobacteraceae bacterium]|nr:hypothetical protein [Steroidobacteraceae bacterium]
MSRLVALAMVWIDGAIMFEVVSDWNYAAAVICRKALSISRAARSARVGAALKALSASIAKKYFRESAFFVVIALTRHLRAAQTRCVE